MYYDDDSNSWEQAVVISRGGKAKGVHKYWFNIKNIKDDNMKCVNFEVIRGWKNLTTEEVLWANTETFPVTEAKMQELQKWKDNDVYDEVPDNGQRRISVRWVITEKAECGKLIVQARLVARGYEECNLCDVRKDSPTCSRQTLRIILAINSSKHCKVHSLDIKSAFLQGKTIERDVYLKQPVEARAKHLWKLKRTVYSLCDAPRAWYPLKIFCVLYRFVSVMHH